MSSFTPPREATWRAYGSLFINRPKYSPLEQVTIRVRARDHADRSCSIRVCDPRLQPYIEQELHLANGEAELTFIAGGRLGTHFIFLYWPGDAQHSRYTNFLLDAYTNVSCGKPPIDNLLPWTRDRMRLGRRIIVNDVGDTIGAGYISGDTLHFNGIWLRDSTYGMPAYQHWEPDMHSFVDAFLDHQDKSGMVPDGIETTGETWRVGMESDVEYILVLATWNAWRASGDKDWLSCRLPQLEHALAYIHRDPKRWDDTYQLVKRQHSCDTWDFDIEGADDAGNSRHVVATCDQTGYYLAYRLMSLMYVCVGDEQATQRWQSRADSYRKRSIHLLWDGVKFKHHVHLDHIDHEDFDEDNQLAMGNTWAMTRGLADAEQARSITDEYHRRYVKTGDAYPWWSLQPGYPDYLGYFKNRPHRHQGGYANGGLMPWVGGELALAAFRCGREQYGYTLLKQYLDHIAQTGGVHVWYWPNGEPGFRTHNEVLYTGWGMAQWVAAALEGLAGIEDNHGQLRQPVIAPRWAVTDVDQATVTYRYSASGSYVAYRWELDRNTREVKLHWTGTASKVHIRLLLPACWRPSHLAINEKPHNIEIKMQDQSCYLKVDALCTTINRLYLTCEMRAVRKRHSV